jgi:hypothetical protein
MRSMRASRMVQPNLGRALEKIQVKYDRIIVIPDEQAHDHVPGPAT